MVHVLKGSRSDEASGQDASSLPCQSTEENDLVFICPRPANMAVRLFYRFMAVRYVALQSGYQICRGSRSSCSLVRNSTIAPVFGSSTVAYLWQRVYGQQLKVWRDFKPCYLQHGWCLPTPKILDAAGPSTVPVLCIKWQIPVHVHSINTFITAGTVLGPTRNLSAGSWRDVTIELI